MSAIRAFIALIAAVLGLVLAIPLVLVGLPFLAVSFLTRALIRLWEPSVVRWPQISEFDPRLGWRIKANVNGHCLTNHNEVFHLTTDSHGWPGQASLAESTVVVLGDSYAFGYAVDHTASFFQINPNLPIKAIGVPGYNMVQELFLMRQLSPQLKDKLVVWFIYLGNDLDGNLSPEMDGYRTPFVRRINRNGECEIVTSHLSPANWNCSSGRFLRNRDPVLAALHSPTFFSERAYSACEYLLGKGAKVCRNAGAHLVVMTIPAPIALDEDEFTRVLVQWPEAKAFDPDYPDRKISEMCRTLGVSFVALKRYLDRGDYKERDDHWTERGHRRVANVLWDLYRDHANSPIPQHADVHGLGDLVPGIVDVREEASP